MKLLNYKDYIMCIKGKAVNSSTNKEVNVNYDVFKGGGGTHFLHPDVCYKCSKTASEIAYYVWNKLNYGQTSINIKTKDLINSDICKCKDASTINKAIKELVEYGFMIAWKDIKDLPHSINVDKHDYLLNVLLIRNISTRKFKEELNVTTNGILNYDNYKINDTCVIAYDFKNKHLEDIFKEKEEEFIKQNNI